MNGQQTDIDSGREPLLMDTGEGVDNMLSRHKRIAGYKEENVARIT
jgi:hypothetical protein